YPIARLVAKTFYSRGGDLHRFWRLFVTGRSNYRRISSPDNTGLAEVLKSNDTGVFRWHWLNPVKLSINAERSDESVQLDDPKVAGIKIHPYWHGLTLEHIEGVLQLAKSKSLPVYVHLGFDALKGTVEVFGRYPEVSVILACGGFPHFDRV